MKLKIKQHNRKSIKAFTLIELTVSIFILMLIAVFSGNIYLNYTNSTRNIKANNVIYGESRFLMERIARELRQNAIDYEEYFNQNIIIPKDGGYYGKHYCSYNNFFYDSGPDGIYTTLEDNESRGEKNTDIKIYYNCGGGDCEAINSIEKSLYLINLAGNQKTILKRVEETVNGEVIGRIAMLKMDGKDFGQDEINAKDSYNGQNTSDPLCKVDDGEGDGKIDTWLCAADYPCKHDQNIINGTCSGYTDLVSDDPNNANYSFVDITPSSLDVMDFKLIIHPKDDPWKAYNMDSIQTHPTVSIQLSVQANPKMLDVRNRKKMPSITLNSTISLRNYDEVNSDCF